MSMQITVPTLGESVSEATVAKWLKKVGDTVTADEPLVELETDKITLEVNAPAAGTISEISAQQGANVAVGALLGTIVEGKAGAAPAKPAAKKEATASAPAPSEAPVNKPSATPDQAAPSARKIAAENDIDLARVSGTGKDGRVTKEDVLSASQAPKHAPSTAPAKPQTPAGPRARAGEEERVRMTRLRQRVAERLKDAQNTAAMLTTFNEADMSRLMALRATYKDSFEKKHGVKLGFMSFFVKACIAALKQIPCVNAEIEGEDIVYKNYYDIGVAVGTEQGLVVPIVRDADKLSFAEVEKTIAGLGKKARDGKLSMGDLTGGTFTISNGGIYGSLMSTPILNPPQSGILGMHKIEDRAVVLNGKIEIRPMMYLALSYDHRIIDGREAVTFLIHVKSMLEDPERLLLDV